MCFGRIANRLGIIKKIIHILLKIFKPMYHTTTTNDLVICRKMKPIDDINVGDIIEMTRTGKEFSVESISPAGIVLKECARIVTFSRSALNERLERNAAIHKPI